jgi:hypothetical protein
MYLCVIMARPHFMVHKTLRTNMLLILLAGRHAVLEESRTLLWLFCGEVD